jgi:endogenous inhibitor of DNA gyrase (YacG/DUF329 family)
VPTDPAGRPKDFPFCSERCRLVDLHRWLSEEYRVPAASPATGEGAEEDEPGDGA